MVERRDGLSFVGDLSVKEYLGEQLEVEPEDEELEGETIEADSWSLVRLVHFEKQSKSIPLWWANAIQKMWQMGAQTACDYTRMLA